VDCRRGACVGIDQSFDGCVLFDVFKKCGARLGSVRAAQNERGGRVRGRRNIYDLDSKLLHRTRSPAWRRSP